MKITPALILTIVGTAVLTAATVVLVQEARHVEPAGLNQNANLADQLNATLRKLDDLEENLRRVENRAEIANRGVQDLGAVTAKQGDLESVDTMQARLAALEARLAAPESTSTLLTNVAAQEPEAVAALEKSLDKVVKERMREQQRRQFKMFEPMMAQGFKRGMDRAAKRLNLNADQSRRLKESSDKTFEAVMPQIGVLFDPNRSNEEKATAFETIESSVKDVELDAASYMDPKQLEDFSKIQGESLEGLNRFRSMFGGDAGGLGGAGATAPASDPRSTQK
ncbi:MAG: hypothetical protein KDB53_08530 [Planctomycetes bacterium]|nr:hypothetical protein [Planctomycetota bacterium]